MGQVLEGTFFGHPLLLLANSSIPCFLATFPALQYISGISSGVAVATALLKKSQVLSHSGMLVKLEVLVDVACVLTDLGGAGGEDEAAGTPG